jgi:glucosamine--fructose-6-phosphate aminotransferase (isomerizing)
MPEVAKDGDLFAAAHGREGHPYRMWDSIHQTPEMLAACLEAPVTKAIDQVAARLHKDVERLYFTGTGTSLYAGTIASYAVQQVAGVPAACQTSFELVNHPPADLDDRAALVVLSHSGGTKVGLEATELAKERGAYTVAITDVGDSRLAASTDDVIVGPGGRELAIPKTRSYITGLLRVYLLGIALARKTRGESSVSGLTEQCQTLPGTLSSLIAGTEDEIREAAAGCVGQSGFYAVGGGPNWLTAMEAALKLMEASLVLAQGFEIEEAIHGPIIALDDATVVFAVAPHGASYDKVNAFARASQVIGSKVVSLAPQGASIASSSSTFIPCPLGIPELLTPILYIAPLYLFAYWLALAKEINPDVLRTRQPKYRQAMEIVMPPGSH